jgi:hypothetical protein
MTEVPGASVLATPDPVPTVATTVLVLVQVPPVTGSLSAILPPAHTAATPEIAPGAGLTVIFFDAKQPLASI